MQDPQKEEFQSRVADIAAKADHMTVSGDMFAKRSKQLNLTVTKTIAGFPLAVVLGYLSGILALATVFLWLLPLTEAYAARIGASPYALWGLDVVYIAAVLAATYAAVGILLCGYSTMLYILAAIFSGVVSIYTSPIAIDYCAGLIYSEPPEWVLMMLIE